MALSSKNPSTHHLGDNTTINDLLIQEPYWYDNILVWADCCLAFFGFLRVSEFTDASYDSTCHLSTKDISVDNCDDPQLLCVKINSQKQTPSERGSTFILVLQMQHSVPLKPYYLTLQQDLIILTAPKDGSTLIHQRFSNILNTLLSRLGFDSTQCNTHSF